MLIELNHVNGADKITQSVVEKCLTEFEGHLYGVEMGVAYGGGIQKIGNKWKERGTVWGFDTFEGHPIKEMIERCEVSKNHGGANSFAARCMDRWYENSEGIYGTEKIKFDYIQNELNLQELSNVHLVKGLVTEQTDVSFIPKLHYAFIDMDWPQAQLDGYNLVQDKIVQNGYLCIHDMIPNGHIPGCYEVYQSILKTNLWELISETPESFLVVLRKK